LINIVAIILSPLLFLSSNGNSIFVGICLFENIHRVDRNFLLRLRYGDKLLILWNGHQNVSLNWPLQSLLKRNSVRVLVVELA